LHQGEIVPQLVDSRIVVRACAHQEVGIIAGRHESQDLRDAPGGQLACSTRAGGVVDEPFASAEPSHEKTP